MMRSMFSITVLLAVPAFAQTNYATVTYLKELAGVNELIKLQREVADKGAAAIVNSGERTGYVRMVRVFPSAHQVGHDVVYFYTRSTPPNFGQAPDNSTFLRAIGMTREEWTAKARSTSTVVKTEIWAGVYSHGSINKGDVVRMGLSNPPKGKAQGYLAYAREYEGAMRAELVKKGVASGMQSWRLLLTPEGAPYNFVNLEAYSKGDGPFQAWPNRQKTFELVHPGKDYLQYRRTSDEVVSSAGSVIYRVETAIWK